MPVAVRLAFGERRIGEQRGGDRLQRQRHAELLHHVRFGGVVQVHLHGAGAGHHVQAQRADLGHVRTHDLVAALRQPRHFIALPLRLEAHAEEAQLQFAGHLRHFVQMGAGFHAGLVDGLQRRTGQFQLAGRFQRHRGTIAQHFDALDRAGRNLRQIGRLRTAVAQQRAAVETAAVDQHQCLVRRQAAQGSRAHEHLAVGHRQALHHERRHQLGQHVLQIGGFNRLDVFLGEYIHRRQRFELGAVGGAGAGDQHRIELGGRRAAACRGIDRIGLRCDRASCAGHGKGKEDGTRKLRTMHGRAPERHDRASTCAGTTGLDKARSLGAICEGAMT
ncbi:hypothetical protein G6F68_010943 [Rhizopus microsporus]|nr:hypothetical protein G6F68_010943 [Rhizopus microsporus]